MSQMSAPEVSRSPTQTTPKPIENSPISPSEGDDYRLIPVHPDELRGVWPVLEPWLLKVIDGMNERHTMQSLIAEVTAQEVVVWAIVRDQDVRGVVGTEIVESPSGLRSLIIRFCVGKKLNEWVHLLDEIEAFARASGCQRIETWARKGWAKHLSDYRMTHVLLEKDL